MIQSIPQIDVKQEIQIAFSGFINREDNHFAEKTEERITRAITLLMFLNI